MSPHGFLYNSHVSPRGARTVLPSCRSLRRRIGVWHLRARRRRCSISPFPCFYSISVLVILHSSLIAYGTSAIFTTTSMASTYPLALAPVFHCTILLAVPPLPSRHGFRAERPPIFLSLLCCITSSLLAILHCPFSLSVPPVQSLNIPRVDFVIFGSRPLAYFGLLHEFEHVR
jgi:hypothetical protein